MLLSICICIYTVTFPYIAEFKQRAMLSLLSISSGPLDYEREMKDMFLLFHQISSLSSPRVMRFGKKQYGSDSSCLSFLFFHHFSTFLIFFSDPNKRKNSLFFSPPFSLSKEDASDAKGR